MKVTINRKEYELTAQATLADAVLVVQAQPPFAAAVNTQFVPKTQYAQHALHEGDHIEIISPVTGG